MSQLLQCRSFGLSQAASVQPPQVSRYCFDVYRSGIEAQRPLAWRFDPLHWKQDGGTLNDAIPSVVEKALFASHCNPWLPQAYQVFCDDPEGNLSVWGDPPGAPRLWLRELHWDRLHRFLCAGESLWWHDEASGYALFQWSATEVSAWLQARGYQPAQLEQNSLGAWAMDCIFSEITMRCMGGTAQRQYAAWPNDAYACLFDHASRNQWSAVSLGNLVEQVAQVFFLNG